MLPNFLVIGAQRAGTTWLDAQLRAHPEIYLPERRKEVHFFDQYYGRGLDWYKDFFKNSEIKSHHKCIGEITPRYLVIPEVPERIHKFFPDIKLIVILRNPVDRAYSQYQFFVRDGNEKKSFREFLDSDPDPFQRGLYCKQLQRFMNYFPKERIQVLFFEKVIKEPHKALHQIGEFLSVDPANFPDQNNAQMVNESYIPRFRTGRALAIRMARYLRSKDRDWIINFAVKVGIERLFGKEGKMPPIDTEMRRHLIARYEPDIAELEKLIGVDLTYWRNPGKKSEPRLTIG